MSDYILKSELINSIPVDLNRQCTLSRCSRSFSSTNGPALSIDGKFIKDRGMLLEFKSNFGYIESVSKWDIQYGGYKVEYNQG